ncbi:RNA polymerase sigma factor for flagellar operon FliA [Arthrobacter pigmenti]|uniref:RNA polymerase sigma factor for flagellar operon FliA n=1 Tax=Arthrobacter pigmenti TaxID=271432 RepID=A0A846RM47_9MICC|nr:sigma-70 family RNA polymerase sigma factor [Arthrobacter pigmenti]NJC21207.1 RNA polymerase sigma factor for flagellar operon FliA [Arthrobacter pigmenti]
MNKVERDQIVVNNLPLVGYLVSELCAKATHLSRDDLASVGALALITSAESYDPSLGVPFGAYARRRITGAFADELRSNDWAPRSARKRIREALAVQETLTGALLRPPTTDELAAAMGVDRATADAALADASRTVSSLDDNVADFIVSRDETPETATLAAERIAYLRASVASLPEKMRYIIEQIYFEDRSVKDLAEELGSTHSAVSQQRSEAIRLMQDGLATHYSDEPDAAYTPQSRVSPNRRTAYLATLADQTMGGITRAARLLDPAAS